MARMLTWHVGPTRMRRGTEVTWQVTCHFRASLKHKDDGQKKIIKPNSVRQDIIIKYWVSIGSIHDVSFLCVVKKQIRWSKKIFIKPNSQRQDRIIKYWVSIGSIHREQG